MFLSIPSFASKSLTTFISPFSTATCKAVRKKYYWNFIILNEIKISQNKNKKLVVLTNFFVFYKKNKIFWNFIKTIVWEKNMIKLYFVEWYLNI